MKEKIAKKQCAYCGRFLPDQLSKLFEVGEDNYVCDKACLYGWRLREIKKDKVERLHLDQVILWSLIVTAFVLGLYYMYKG